MTDGRPGMRTTRVRAGAQGAGKRRHSAHGIGNGASQRPRVTAPSPHQAAVLECVGDVPQRAGEIAARAGVSATSAHNALAHLRGKEYVRHTKKGWVRA